jgi:uncharacterized YccA/Bax inhibitor family protein
MFEANPTIRRIDHENVSGNSLTFNGVINRTGGLLLITGLTFALTWNGIKAEQLPLGAGIVGSLVGFVLALIIIFTRATNPILIGAYAVTQGVALGVISYLANLKYPGIALQAVAGTIGSFSIVLFLYSMRILRASPIFVKVLMASMLGIAALYLVNFVSTLFGHPLDFLVGNSGLSIGISAFIVLIASLSFVIDFAAIEQAVEEGVDVRHGWHFAFSLLVGLVWLYIEILRLLSKLRSRN